MYKLAEFIGRAFTASVLSWAILWIASNIFGLVFSFWPFFSVCFIIMFILWY